MSLKILVKAKTTKGRRDVQNGFITIVFIKGPGEKDYSSKKEEWASQERECRFLVTPHMRNKRINTKVGKIIGFIKITV